MQGRKWLVPCLCLLAMLATTASASASRSVYPPDQDAITLRDGPAGWTGGTSSEGLCVPVVLCPAITNSVPSSGGPGGSPGSGFLRTELGSLTGVGATSIGTFDGPSFTYRGVGGQTPAKLLLRLSRRADVAALLDVTGNEAGYSVRLLNLSGGPDVSIVDGSGLEGAPEWTQVPGIDVDPAQLQPGNRYRVEISSRFESGVEVLPGGFADYAKVRLIAKSGRRGGNGHDGHDGQNGHDGADAVGGVIADVVRIKGRYLVVGVKCARRAPKRKCKSRLTGRLSKHGPKVTATQRARVKAGHRTKVRLRIQGGYRKQVATSKRITVQRKTRVAGKVKTTYARAKVRG